MSFGGHFGEPCSAFTSSAWLTLLFQDMLRLCVKVLEFPFMSWIPVILHIGIIWKQKIITESFKGGLVHWQAGLPWQRVFENKFITNIKNSTGED